MCVRLCGVDSRRVRVLVVFIMGMQAVMVD
jgi:hypothetical protein